MNNVPVFEHISKKDIFEEAKGGKFSERLLRVLRLASIYIPPLRQRRDDIEPIADFIIQKYDLNLTDETLQSDVKECYETCYFQNGLKDLKRLLFLFSAKHSVRHTDNT